MKRGAKQTRPPVTLASPYTCTHCGRAASIREWVNNERKCPACGTLATGENVRGTLGRELRRARRHEPAALAPLVIGGDHEHGLLPKFAGDDFRDTLGAAEDAVAAPANGRGGDFDDQGVFPLSLPNTPGPRVRRAGKGAGNQPLHLVHERLGVEGRGEPAVPTRLAGYTAPDEEADRAHGLEVPPAEGADVPPPYRSLAHAASVTRDPKNDTRRHGAPSWLRFEVVAPPNRVTALRIETCWLPDLPEVRRALPAEFTRTEEGTFVALADADDEVKIARLSTKALHAILRELSGEAS